MKPYFSLFLLLLSVAPISVSAAPKNDFWTTVNGHPLHFIAHGQGRPLLLLHGGGDTPNRSFSKQIKAFAAHHRVIAPEQIGHGETPELPGPLSYTQMMDDTVALLEQLHVGSTDVVGWSDGGIIGLMLAVHHPELIRRIVVSGANIAPEGLEDFELAEARSHVNVGPIPFAPNLFSEPSFADKLGRLWGSSPTADELNPTLLSHVRQPVLVMAGAHDVIKPAHTLEIYDSLPAGRLWILPETSHDTFSERPDLVNPVVLSFLDD
ncbi:MAG: alpha/beta hydrolase [Gammaproteobacteria bacterium]|nr:alpha/beta hydrolase [Gammaproteobacteria bacterium]